MEGGEEGFAKDRGSPNDDGEGPINAYSHVAIFDERKRMLEGKAWRISEDDSKAGVKGVQDFVSPRNPNISSRDLDNETDERQIDPLHVAEEQSVQAASAKVGSALGKKLSNNMNLMRVETGVSTASTVLVANTSARPPNKGLVPRSSRSTSRRARSSSVCASTRNSQDKGNITGVEQFGPPESRSDHSTPSTPVILRKRKNPRCQASPGESKPKLQEPQPPLLRKPFVSEYSPIKEMEECFDKTPTTRAISECSVDSYSASEESYKISLEDIQKERRQRNVKIYGKMLRVKGEEEEGEHSETNHESPYSVVDLTRHEEEPIIVCLLSVDSSEDGDAQKQVQGSVATSNEGNTPQASSHREETRKHLARRSFERRKERTAVPNKKRPVKEEDHSSHDSNSTCSTSRHLPSRSSPPVGEIRIPALTLQNHETFDAANNTDPFAKQNNTLDYSIPASFHSKMTGGTTRKGAEKVPNNESYTAMVCAIAHSGTLDDQMFQHSWKNTCVSACNSLVPPRLENSVYLKGNDVENPSFKDEAINDAESSVGENGLPPVGDSPLLPKYLVPDEKDKELVPYWWKSGLLFGTLLIIGSISFILVGLKLSQDVLMMKSSHGNDNSESLYDLLSPVPTSSPLPQTLASAPPETDLFQEADPTMTLSAFVRTEYPTGTPVSVNVARTASPVYLPWDAYSVVPSSAPTHSIAPIASTASREIFLEHPTTSPVVHDTSVPTPSQEARSRQPFLWQR